MRTRASRASSTAPTLQSYAVPALMEDDREECSLLLEPSLLSRDLLAELASTEHHVQDMQPSISYIKCIQQPCPKSACNAPVAAF